MRKPSKYYKNKIPETLKYLINLCLISVKSPFSINFVPFLLGLGNTEKNKIQNK